MRRTPVVVGALAVVLGTAGVASASAGTGSVTDTLTATVAAGALVLTGTGASLAVSPTPGTWSSSVGATALTVADTTGTTNGWSVTATYSAPSSGLALGGAGVQVTSASPTGAIVGSALTLASAQPLTSPVTVATTGAGTGAGTTAFTSSYKVLVPSTATVGQVYGATVTYTVASVR